MSSYGLRKAVPQSETKRSDRRGTYTGIFETTGDSLMGGWEDELRDGDRLKEGQSEGKKGIWFEVAARQVTERKRENEIGFEET